MSKARNLAMMAVALGLLGDTQSVEPYRPRTPLKRPDTHATPSPQRAKVKAARKQRRKTK